MQIWKKVFPAGATVGAKALRWEQDCFVGETLSSVEQMGEQLKSSGRLADTMEETQPRETKGVVQCHVISECQSCDLSLWL